MCETCADGIRTAEMLDDLSAYAATHGADRQFVDITAYALALSLALIPPPSPESPDCTDPDQ